MEKCEACGGLGVIVAYKGIIQGLRMERCDACEKYPSDDYIYNQLEMLGQDVPWGNAVSALGALSTMYHIYIIAARTENLREKTLEVMTQLGFALDDVTIFFKGEFEQLYSYRKKCMQEVIKLHPTGVGVCLNPTDAGLFKDFDYTPVGLTSLKAIEEFTGHIDVVCNDWAQILSALNCSGGS